MSRPRRRLRSAIPVLVWLLPLGCHSAFVNATITNRSGAPVHLVEVDYPNASFGTEDLPAGGVFRYHFKIQGTGGTKLSWTDQGEHDHASEGPTLLEGEMGSLAVTINSGGAVWSQSLHSR